MDSTTGWLLDVTVEQNVAILWIKTIVGTIPRTGHPPKNHLTV
jgi:hypothetical protein